MVPYLKLIKLISGVGLKPDIQVSTGLVLLDIDGSDWIASGSWKIYASYPVKNHANLWETNIIIWKITMSNTQMLHGAGIFTYIWVIFGVNVGKYSSTMEHLG